MATKVAAMTRALLVYQFSVSLDCSDALKIDKIVQAPLTP